MAWYAVEPRPHGAGSTIVPLYADFHHEGEVTRQAAPRVNHLDFDPSMAYFRMLFMSRRTGSNDHDIFLVAAPTLALLEERTRAVETDAGSCDSFGSPSGDRRAPSSGPQAAQGESYSARHATARTTCIVAPRQVAVVAFLAVRVQGKEVMLHPGATLESALRETGGKTDLALPTLSVHKPYGRRLAAVEAQGEKRDLLALPLSGGEEIRW